MESTKESFQIKSFQISQTEWLQFLLEHGAVVIKNIIPSSEVKIAISLFWDWMENLNSGLNRNDSTTWINSCWPGNPDLGFFTGYGGCHSKASWYLRTRPDIKKAFAKIWKVKQEDLITSFDTFIAWRPWWQNKSWKPFVENLHVDQNPSVKKGFHCVQGMVPLYDVDEVGGLMVVPNTNNDTTQQQLQDRYSHTTYTSSDWLQLRSNDPYIGKGTLIKCKAGDLILFDSRTIHGGLILQPSQKYKQEKEKNQLVRLSMTVTMTPRSLATKFVLEKRKLAFQRKIGLTHWPHEYNVSGMNIVAHDIKRQMIKQDVIQMTQEIRQLIG